MRPYSFCHFSALFCSTSLPLPFSSYWFIVFYNDGIRSDNKDRTNISREKFHNLVSLLVMMAYSSLYTVFGLVAPKSTDKRQTKAAFSVFMTFSTVCVVCLRLGNKLVGGFRVCEIILRCLEDFCALNCFALSDRMVSVFQSCHSKCVSIILSFPLKSYLEILASNSIAEIVTSFILIFPK